MLPWLLRQILFHILSTRSLFLTNLNIFEKKYRITWLTYVTFVLAAGWDVGIGPLSGIVNHRNNLISMEVHLD